MHPRLLFALLALFCAGLLSAQRGPVGRTSPGHAYGRVLGADRKPVAFASASVLVGDSVVGGALVQENGDFDITGLPLGALRLRIAGLGYATLEKEFTLTREIPELDLGNLMIEVDEVVLQAAEISKERATQVLQVDRRVYNVDKDISVAGGDATDVMKNIPGLSVDADGNVEMRGKSPKVFVDGRPTTLTLDQIPASDIERVEVITNPSVIFDASSTGGIVNVVMKKSTRPGYSGQLQAGIGTNERYNLNGNLLMRQGRNSFSLNAGFGHSASPRTSYNYRTDLADGLPTSYFRQDANGTHEHMRINARLGWDYKLSNRNTISLLQGVYIGSRSSSEDQVYTTSDAANNTTGSGTQHNISDGTYNNYNTRVGFKRTTTKPGKEWSTDLTFNLGDNTSPATREQFNQGSDGILPGQSFQGRDSKGDNQEWTWQLDVTDPYADNRKLEWGFKANYELSNSTMDVTYGNDTLPGLVRDTALSNAFRIGTWVNAAYINWSTKLSTHWSMQSGLRVEQNVMDAKRTDKDVDFSYSYPDGLDDLGQILFPAVYLSRKWDAPDGDLQRELQINVSRKVNRPRFYQIMPFIMSTDARSYRIGNPTLRPEMSTILEVNHLLPLGENGNWLSSIYGRFTDDVITSYTAPLPSDPNILVTTYVNGDQNQSFGWENTIKLTLWKGSEATLNGNVQWVRIGLAENGVNYTNNGISFDGKVNFSQKLPHDFTLQVNADYDGPRIIPQGHTLDRSSMDFTLRKQFSRRFFVTASVNNIFDSRGWGSYYETPNFEQESFRSWGSRELRVSATWRFGKQDTQLFRKKSTGPTTPSEPGGGGGDDGGGE
ncbi:MAG: TonB-dependent receptor [Flavobacteriales bacterium]|nr:TonB-dependent receptor [Flavobacteriales bacterium]